MLIVSVCVPHTSRDGFDYHVADEEPCIGARVLVPFRNKDVVGMVIGKKTQADAGVKTKAIKAVLDDKPLLPAALLMLCRWVSGYYQSPLSEVLPLALPKKYREGDAACLPAAIYYSLQKAADAAHQALAKQAVKQHQLVDFMATAQTPVAKKTLLEKGFKNEPIKRLLDLGILAEHETVEPWVSQAQTSSTPHCLHDEQALAVETIVAELHHYRCFLLQGVTGSGKTEVYLQVIARVLAAGKQVLVLVPEIGLTPQLLARFSQRFHQPMAVLHSNLSDRERQIAWQQAYENIAKLIIGTRSAVFTPMPQLGLIVIDEEHDASLKQMEGVRYSARETALMRAHQQNVPIILGSATPSLESLHNCTLGKHQLLTLTHKAVSTIPLHYQILDIRNQALQHGLALPSLQRINHHLDAGNQVLVFINRRGFAPVLLCHQCGWMADCRACDSHLTLHREMNKLVCHHCGLILPIPHHCQACRSIELIPIGVGTQRVHEFLAHQFPETDVVRVDRDEVRRKTALNLQLERINRGEAQLIIGTQMLAKGHHFPRLTLVVVVDADNGFYNQDFRALERLGQLLTQVAGRAGRAEHAGEVVIQTHLPHHPLLNVLVQEGYDAFATLLLEQRQQSALPPFQSLALIRAQGKHLPAVLAFMHRIRSFIENPNALTPRLSLVSEKATAAAFSSIMVLGPAPAPLARKGGYHRAQLLLKSPSRKNLHAALTELRSWLTMNNLTQNVRWNVDVDPMDLS